MKNVITLFATVLAPRNDRPNPVRISDSFAAVNVTVEAEKGKAFVDVVGANGVGQAISVLRPGDNIRIVGRLDSHKGQGEQARWRLRIFADAIELLPKTEPEPEQAQLEEATTA